MRRVTVISKIFWHSHPRGGGHTTEEYDVLCDLSDKALQKKLDEMNKPYRSNLWEIKGDYHLSKKKELYAYAEYCVNCAQNPYCKDVFSKSLGTKFFETILAGSGKQQKPHGEQL